MGEELYKIIRKSHPMAVRVYAPVGNNRDLLPYLVRRLLENGSNTSFVHKIYDKTLSLEEIMGDPWVFFESHSPGLHPRIPLPKDLYGKCRKNSQGYDLNDRKTLAMLKADLKKSDDVYETLKETTIDDLKAALQKASTHWELWDLTPAERRGEILNRAGNLIEERHGLFLNLLIKEGKKTLPDAVSELREAVDYCRYYAAESFKHFATPQTLRGPTGEVNQLVLRGRGVFACISPWNFPLAIFMGQVTAALAAGNAVIAKPASLTPLIAFHAVKTLHDAGVPREILHYLHGRGSVLGTPLVEDLRVNGVVFTGSTSTAQEIQKSLSTRGGPIVPFIAETGGLNAMIVDSSALIEQVVDDVVASAFQSAGQRCSALRILFIQDDIYEQTLTMLRQAMEELTVGDPQWLSTDVGPVIDEGARDEIEAYIKAHPPLARTPLPKVKGTFVAPTLIEVNGMEDVKREVFGPVLHVARFKAQDLEQVVKSINQSGYGLTMGVQSRIERTINQVRELGHAGNLYVNRNMIGAVVGVQPFGGEGLSGSGPKAGGPYYLPRFGVERTFSYNITASGGNVDLLNLEE
jgi:RHH-type transcriptional regulator, proline utilization regulon repressor / proline dehydrogenase / delta 1-pyrroline-5-carboxylate dehydrogenase